MKHAAGRSQCVGGTASRALRLPMQAARGAVDTAGPSPRADPSRDKRRERRTSPESAALPGAPSPKSIWPVRRREYNPCTRRFTPVPRGVKFSGPGCHNASGDWSRRLPRSRPGPALQAPAYPRPPAGRTSGCTSNSAAALNRWPRGADVARLPKRQSAGWRKRRRGLCCRTAFATAVLQHGRRRGGGLATRCRVGRAGGAGKTVGKSAPVSGILFAPSSTTG